MIKIIQCKIKPDFSSAVEFTEDYISWLNSSGITHTWIKDKNDWENVRWDELNIFSMAQTRLKILG